jgi:fumarate reductase subunit C
MSVTPSHWRGSRIARSGPRHAYRRRVSTWWWLERWPYFAFVMREMTSVFVAWSVLWLLLLLRAAGEGEVRYRAFFAWSASPLILVLNGVTVVLLVYHTITWFNLVPQVMVVRLRQGRLPGAVLAGSHYLAWAAVTVGLAWLLVGR